MVGGNRGAIWGIPAQVILGIFWRGCAMKRTAFIVGAFLIGVVALIFYFQQLPPEGVEPMGEEVTIAWISLAVAIISLLTAIIGLIQKIIEARQKLR